MFLVLLCLIILVLFISWIRFILECRRFNIPGPMPLPLIGNAHMFICNSSEYLKLLGELSLKYGDAFRVHLLSTPYVTLSHPKYIEPLISSSELITKGKSYDFTLPWLGQGLLTASGNRWKAHRKFLTPAFHFNMLQNFLPVFCKNEQILRIKLSNLANGEPVDLFPLMAHAALDNVTESIMGVSVNAQKNASIYVEAIQTLSYLLSLRMQVPIIGEDAIFNLLPYKKKQDEALKIIHGQSKRVIDVRRNELANLNITNLKGSSDLGIKNKYAFLDLLLLSEIDGKRIDDEKVREEVDTFMFEGHDTTASGLVYSLFCLSKHEDVQEKLLAEQINIFGDDMDRNPTYNELHQMKYLDMVIKECFRLYPPVPAIERLITKDVQVGDLQLIKGTSVTINIFQTHRNPKVYDNPLEFRPERFDVSSEARNPFSWIAFSAGPRNCIGQRFAMMEMKVTLSGIIRQFKLLPVDDEPILCAELVLRTKKGVFVRLQPRHRSDVRKD